MEVFQIKQELPINGQIREKEVQLIGVNGEKLGVMPTQQALELAGKEIQTQSQLHQTVNQQFAKS